jgi:integrase
MQRGSLVKVARKNGPDVWQFRWSEKGGDGRRVYRKRVIGTIEQYFDAAEARRLAARIIAKPGFLNSRPTPAAMTVADLCRHFQHRELAQNDVWRSHSTTRNYIFYLNKWIIPRWQNYELAEVRTVEVEAWLRSLPLARSTCAKIRNLMSVLFNHAWRHDFFDRNPISLARQSAKRRKAPNVLTPAEIKSLLDSLALRERTLVLLAASTGLRQSELFALKWEDIDFAHGTMNVTRAIAYGVVGKCKTEASQKPVPLHPILAEALTLWRVTCFYGKPEDWVFASRQHRGRRPLWGQAILRKYVRPAAERIGIEKRIGWHTFRHIFSTLLRSVGAEFKIMQELMRHSSVRSTLNVYTQAVTPAKREAQAAVLLLVFPSQFARADVELPPHSS